MKGRPPKREIAVGSVIKRISLNVLVSVRWGAEPQAFSINELPPPPT